MMNNNLKNINLISLFLSIVFLISINNSFADHFLSDEKGTTIDSLNPSELNWYNMDVELNDVPGTSVNRTYQEIIQNKKPIKKVVVAVIDGGVDVKHEDLDGKIWVNHDETPANGVDDDGNGYVDDIHGWNFLGNAQGENINFENLEYVRILRKLQPKFEDLPNPEQLTENEKANYELYLECKKTYENELEKYQEEKESIQRFESRIEKFKEILREHTGSDELTYDEIENIESDDDKVLAAQQYMILLHSNGFTDQSLNELKDHIDKYLDKHLNLSFAPRTLINDNLNNLEAGAYGNNDVKGPSSSHGSFVAGIIAANRSNRLGIDGIAENVEIMAIRAVPQGDEYDKDVALAIRYAVDNGANIINMSFGKQFSPQKQLVDEALKYAEQKNVLVINSAGNSAYDIDKVMLYPNDQLIDGSTLNNFLTVGAISRENDMHFVGDFSNYGRKNVDLFAPGVDIISLFPNDTYESASGTSFSSPVVSGIAAMVWSYYPELTASELKELLMKSTKKFRKLKVYVPGMNGERKKTKFKKLSKSGGVVNAYQAMMLAEKKYANN